MINKIRLTLNSNEESRKLYEYLFWHYDEYQHNNKSLLPIKFNFDYGFIWFNYNFKDINDFIMSLKSTLEDDSSNEFQNINMDTWRIDTF